MRFPTRFPILTPAAILLALAVPAANAANAASSQETAAPAKKPPAAASQQAPASGPQRLAQLDTDHDGKVSRSEWKGNDISFAMLDRNGDGFLTADELSPPSPPPVRVDPNVVRARQEKIFRWMDANHDGRITKAEWREDAAKFARLDRNHDGVLTLEEYLQK